MIMRLKVHANSSQEKLKKINSQEYEIWIKEKPMDNKANSSIIKKLKKHFKKPVRIKSGFTSKNKIIEIGDKNEI